MYRAEHLNAGFALPPLYPLLLIPDFASSKPLIPLSFLADAPAACDAVFGACAGSQPGAFPSAMHGINLDRW